jgi:ABC-2 type transport system permease protein
MSRLVLHQWRYDLRSFMRDTQARFFTVALPVVFLVIFVSVFGDRELGPTHVKASTYYVPGIAALAVISSSFFNLVVTVTAQRESGVLKRRRASPVPASVVIAGRTLTAMVVSLVVTAILLLIGRIAYGVQLPASAIPSVAVTATVGSAAFCCLGYAVSIAIKSEDAAQPAVQAIMLPLYFISGVFIPNVNLPPWMRDVAKGFPVQHLASGLHHAFVPGASVLAFPWLDIGVLALWGAAGLVIALRRFSWVPASVTT